jgi:maltooligosyltrehalose trehalohydrolase
VSAARPALGAAREPGGVRFRVWAPERRELDVRVETAGREATRALRKDADGFFGGFVEGIGAGDLYRFRLDGEGPFPDPASRFQPRGVHGPSEVVDPAAFAWSDAGWPGVPLEGLVVYELHVGTFSPRGTFAGVVDELPRLVDLGATAVELMPLADFPGSRNWGYDGASLFAPARCYGRPDELRRLVDEAHRQGLGVLLDVVYNHFGPDGAYWGLFSPHYFSSEHQTPWGAALNLDGPSSGPVRDFFVENATRWLREYHLDGLRLDATHALVDDSPRHFLAEMQDRVRAAVERPVLLIAEDHRNLAAMVRPEAEGGWGLDAVWADDFHHEVRRCLAGDHEGYYRDFTGTVADVAATVRDGWFFKGQHSEHFGGPRGTDPAGLPPRRFVFFLQNHDQVGNRALGERLHHQVEPAAFRAATVLLLCAPETPLLFMGQEWAAPEPFLYFTDHEPGLGRLVTEGRRREFRGFSAFSDPAQRERIPDPQALSTFERSRLDWTRREEEPHASTLRLHRALLRLRREEPLLRDAPGRSVQVAAVDEGALAIQYGRGERALLVVVRLRGAGDVRPATGRRGWREVLSTEDAAFAGDPQPPSVEEEGDALVLAFSRPGAVLLLASGAGVDARRPGSLRHQHLRADAEAADDLPVEDLPARRGEAEEPEGTAAPHEAGTQRVDRRPEATDRARRDRLAERQAGQAQPPAGSEHASRLPERGPDVVLGQQVEHVGRQEAVAGTVGEREPGRALRALHAGPTPPWRDAGAGQPDHRLADVEAGVGGLGGKPLPQQSLGQTARAAAELDDRPGALEPGVPQEHLDRRVLVEPLEVLLRPEPVVEGPRLLVRQHPRAAHPTTLHPRGRPRDGAAPRTTVASPGGTGRARREPYSRRRSACRTRHRGP